MKSDRKTKNELIEELESSRRKVKKLEALLEKRKHTEPDITECKRIEESLREREIHFRSLYENSTLGLYRTTPDGEIILANPTLIGMLGYSSFEELAARNLEQEGFEPSYERKHFIEKIELNGEVKGLESAWTRGDGSTVYIRESARVIRDSDGKTLYYDGSVEDITERKQAEEMLRESEEKYRSLVDGSNEAILVLQEGVVKFASLRAVEVAGYLGTNIIGKHFQEFIYPEDRQMVVDNYVKRMKGEPALSRYKFRLLSVDGSAKWVEMNAVQIDWNGKPASLIFLTDITEHKQAEDEINKSHEELRMLADHLQNIREEERNHLAREFHDQLGQSMTALKMDLSLLLRTISDEKQDISRTYIAGELKSAKKLLDEMSRSIWEIIADLRPQMLDDLGLLAALEWETEGFEWRTGITCKFKSFAGDIQMDSKKSIALFRIYQEVLTNISRHAHATVVKSVLQRDGEMLVFEVKDDGCGIIHNEQFKSNSFGLIGMRERALALGGQFEISGIAGEGTTIIVRLPL